MGKIFGVFLVTIASLLFIFGIIMSVVANYHYTKDFTAYWSLSDKSSTLEAKAMYIGQFVDKLNASRDQFADYNAVFLKTPDNSFDRNYGALITLRDRLKTISQMNESDFAYQSAMQQITAQEQGQADEMMNVFQGCYMLRSYPYLWDWFIGISILILTILFGAGCYMISRSH